MKFTMYHACITVLDLEKSMKFYEETLGLQEIRRIEASDGTSKIVFMGSEGAACPAGTDLVRGSQGTL